ncbi:IS200/IS605 family transposase [Aphanizomenon sp. CS-733/32]|uniref:IS200/IS605 family transposase n=1 Tax=Aphanizomenon sp. CS-733/32 TaxID=3021715 RepID=UPI00232B1A07|nr:IS200/IS605 family transposase [Aphanizomenon sp. CS-733/32]MDB9307531.1 IS200/IS605 family transposase [Aphanizomenon sp. CS-733/32]
MEIAVISVEILSELIDVLSRPKFDRYLSREIREDFLASLARETELITINETMEIMPDHVHLFLNVKPTDDPSSIMRKIKGRASHHLRKEFPELLKIPTLWTPSYFVSTAGNICTETVKKYIEQQRD